MVRARAPSNAWRTRCPWTTPGPATRPSRARSRAHAYEQYDSTRGPTLFLQGPPLFDAEDHANFMDLDILEDYKTGRNMARQPGRVRRPPALSPTGCFPRSSAP